MMQPQPSSLPLLLFLPLTRGVVILTRGVVILTRGVVIVTRGVVIISRGVVVMKKRRRRRRRDVVKAEPVQTWAAAVESAENIGKANPWTSQDSKSAQLWAL